LEGDSPSLRLPSALRQPDAKAISLPPEGVSRRLPGWREARGPRFTDFGRAKRGKSEQFTNKINEMSLPNVILAW
jgi:hypothetical protein